jgi:branched-chain amino acid transport system substrate-binding protein
MWHANAPLPNRPVEEDHIMLRYARCLTSRLSCVALVLVVVLAATSLIAAAQETVKIGGVFSLTGKLTSLGLPGATAAKLAVKEINERGGITVGGKRLTIDFVLRDDRGIAAEAVASTLELTTKENIRFIFGPIGTVVGMPAVEVTRKAGVMHFNPLTGIGPLVGKPEYPYLFQTYNWEFGERGRIRTYAPFIAKTAKEHGIKRVAILDSTDDYSSQVLEAYVPKLKELGLEILTVERYDRAGTVDFYPQLTKIKALKPDALIWGYSDEAGKLIVRQALETAVTKKFISWQGATEVPALPYKDQLELYTWVIGTRSPQSEDPKMRDWTRRMMQVAGQDLGPSLIWGLTIYDQVFMLAKAMEVAGTTTDLDRIKRALIGTTYEGAMKLTVTGDNRFVHDYYIGMIQKGAIKYAHIPVE